MLRQSGMETVGFEDGLLRWRLRMLTIRLICVVNSSADGDFKYFFT